MRASACASIYKQISWHIMYFLNLLHFLHRLSLIFAFYDNLVVFFFASILTQNFIWSYFLDFALMQHQLCHEWFLHIRKKMSEFEQFWVFKCIPATKSRFLTHNEITQDYARFQWLISNTDVPENFKSLGWIVQPLGQFQFDNVLAHTLNTQHQPHSTSLYTLRLDRSVCYSLICE